MPGPVLIERELPTGNSSRNKSLRGGKLTVEDLTPLNLWAVENLYSPLGRWNGWEFTFLLPPLQCDLVRNTIEPVCLVHCDVIGI